MITMRWRERRSTLIEPLIISRGAITDNHLIEVELRDGESVGRGEAHPVTYVGETAEGLAEALAVVRPAVEAGASRMNLLTIMPTGAARFALDAALWDLEAKRDGTDPFAANGVTPAPVASARTIGIRSPADFAAAASALAATAVLKIKVDVRDPLAAVEAVHRAAPAARLVVDANQGWTVDQTRALAPQLVPLGVVLLEQPIPVGAEAELDGWTSPVPLCADELVDDEEDLERAAGRFGYVNIKLEKAGGLTGGMALARTAQARGFGLMVGCMGGTSRSMAPGMVLAQLCDFIDLDAPLFLEEDVADGFAYRDGVVANPHRRALWG